jgi:hypothetical protein
MLTAILSGLAIGTLMGLALVGGAFVTSGVFDLLFGTGDEDD